MERSSCNFYAAILAASMNRNILIREGNQSEKSQPKPL